MNRILSAMLGRFAPQLRTFDAWCAVYDSIIAARPLTSKTLQNRRCNIGHLCRRFGGRRLSGIRPHEIAALIKQIHADSQFAARRVLIEARELFGEAVNYGWININPAASVRSLPVRIQRRRLSLDQWQLMHARASNGVMRPWVRCMLELALLTGQRRADLAKMSYADVWDDHLHIVQQKTGARVAIPLAIRLDAIGMTLAEAIDRTRDIGSSGETMLRKSTGAPLGLAALSFCFERLYESVHGVWIGPGTKPCLHECRSLSERLYREQGINTQTLLGHSRQAMTDKYNDDRGLTRGQWKYVRL